MPYLRIKMKQEMFCRCFLLLGLKSCSIDKELWHETYGATYQKKKKEGGNAE